MVWLGATQGGVGAKHAVNPSMGARSRHPWRSRFCPHSALRRVKDRQRLLVPPGSREKKIKFKFKFKFKFKGKSRSRNSWLCFCFRPCSRLGVRCVRARRKLSRGGPEAQAGPLAPWTRGMPRAGWAGRPTPALPCAQDCAHEQAATEPPWVRVLCLRSTASRAPERPAASGWAGPRSGVYGVSWLRPPASQTQQQLGAKRLNPALYSDSPDSRRRSR